MQIQKFNNEKELDNWVESNIEKFFGKNIIFIKGEHFIYTKRDKGAKPDGFVLDLENQSWTIIENELIAHGVWEHIAEQIMRFIVASKSSRTQKTIRDLFLNEIENQELISNLSTELKVSESRIFQKIENIIEGQIPDIAIFIDDVNEDLEDMVDALNATVKVFRVQKFDVDGKVEIFSPDQNQPALEISLEEVKSDGYLTSSVVIDILGGGNLSKKVGFIYFYSLDDGSLVSIKSSKKYDNDGFWFGITPSTLEHYKEEKLSHLVLTLAEEGVVKLPLDILNKYIEDAFSTKKPDGTIKHYHIYLKIDRDKVILYKSSTKNIFEVDDYFISAN